MRFPTSVRPPSAAQMAYSEADGGELFRQAAQPKVGEPVVAAWGFARQGLMINKLAGHFGALPYAIARKRQEMRAGGFPEHFVLAVTEERVYALERKIGRRDPFGTVGEELARWDRASLRVSWKPDRTAGGMLLNVKIESPAEGETVNCSVGNGPETERFLGLLAEAAAVA